MNVQKRAASCLTPSMCVLLAASLAACADDKDTPPSVGDASVEAGHPDASADASTNLPDASDAGSQMDARLPDTGTVIEDASLPVDSSEAGSSDAAMADDSATAGDGAAADAGLHGDGGLGVLTASALQVGRFGSDLRIFIGASRALNDVVAVRVELFDGQAAALGTVRVLPLDTPVTLGEGSASVLLPGVFDRYPGLQTVRVVLVDDTEVQSAPSQVAVEHQPVRMTGESCDVNLVHDRCAIGLGCKGLPGPFCKEGEAPTLSRAGYYADRLGNRILLEGQDPDFDAVGYRLRFLDAMGQAVSVQLPGDDMTPGAASNEFTGTIKDRNGMGFFVAIEPSIEFVDGVASVEVTVFDQGDRVSAPLTVARSTAPERGLDASCDPRGFHLCPEASVCSGAVDQAHCRSVDDAERAACDAALVLTPSMGVNRVRGSLGVSLWEPPTGCSSGQPGEEDRVVKLVLASPAASVVLSTDHAYTGFDTVLYLLNSCASAPRLAWCVADQAGGNPKAILTLTDLPAGEYFVVVDSFPSVEQVSTTFELSVTVQ